MPRSLHLDDDGLVVDFSGILLLGTWRRRLRVPWAAVRVVRVEPYPLRPLPLKVGRSTLGRSAHGRFRRGRRWLFLSFSDPACVVRLELDRSVPGASGFDEAVFGVEDPVALAAAIAPRLNRPAALAA